MVAAWSRLAAEHAGALSWVARGAFLFFTLGQASRPASVGRLSGGDEVFFKHSRQHYRHQLGALHQLREQMQELGEADEQDGEVKHVLKAEAKCCLCSDGAVQWSLDGSCNGCSGQVEKSEVTAQQTCQQDVLKGGWRAAQECYKACSVQLTPPEVVKDEEVNDVLKGALRCCLCSDGAVEWSVDGSCSKCSGQVDKSEVPTQEICQDVPKRSQLRVAWDCQRACRVQVKSPKDVELNQAALRCCLCSDGAVQWSVDGSCSKCSGQVAKSEVPAQLICQLGLEDVPKVSHLRFTSNCQMACRAQLQSPAPEVVKASVGLSTDSNLPVQKDLVTENLEASVGLSSNGNVPVQKDLVTQNLEDEGVKKAASRCCLCSDGGVSWSLSGTCSRCSGQVDKSEVPAKESCQAGLENVPDGSRRDVTYACLEACNAQLTSSPETVKALTTNTTDPVTQALEASVNPSNDDNATVQKDPVTEQLEAGASAGNSSQLFNDTNLTAQKDPVTEQLEADNKNGVVGSTKLDVVDEEDDLDGEGAEEVSSGSASKCCRCRKKKRIIWSIDGTCRKCHQEVEQEEAAPGACATGVQGAEDRHVKERECHTACVDIFNTPATGEVVQPVKVEDENGGTENTNEVDGVDNDLEGGEEVSSGSASKCCMCRKNKRIIWSIDGTCRKCHLQVEKEEPAPGTCATGVQGADDRHVKERECHTACVDIFNTPATGEVVQPVKVEDETGSTENANEVDGVDNDLEGGEEVSSGSASKCCRCRKNKRIIWSIDGTCRKCHLEVEKEEPAPGTCATGVQGADDRHVKERECHTACVGVFNTPSTEEVEQPVKMEEDASNNPELEGNQGSEEVSGGSASKCCMCRKNKRIIWSIDGTCRKCHQQVDKEEPAPGACATGVEGAADRHVKERECHTACAEVFGQPVLGEEGPEKGDQGEEDSANLNLGGSEDDLGNGEGEEAQHLGHNEEEEGSANVGDEERERLEAEQRGQDANKHGSQGSEEDRGTAVQGEDFQLAPGQKSGGGEATGGGEFDFNTFLESVGTVEGALKEAEQRAQAATQASSRWATEPKQAMEQASAKSAEEYNKVARELAEGSRKVEQEESRHFREALGGP